MRMIYYKSKKKALEMKKGREILCNKGMTKYFMIDSYTDFLSKIKTDTHADYFEYISSSSEVKLYFDIDINENSEYYSKPYDLPLLISEKVGDMNYVLLESPSAKKGSFHMVFRDIGFKNVKDMKSYVCKLDVPVEVDKSVYREGIFRTIHSSKPNEKRPFVIAKNSPLKDELDSFVCYRVPEDVVDSGPEYVVDSTPCLTAAQIVDEDKYKKVNTMLNRERSDENWELSKINGGWKAVPGCEQCLVNPEKQHSHKDHSALFLNKDLSVVKSCFSCGSEILTKKESIKIHLIFKVLLKIDEDKNTYQNLQKDLQKRSEEKGYKREKGTGTVYERVKSYAYVRYKTAEDYLNELFKDDDEFNNNVNNMDNMVKYMKQYDSSQFGFLEFNNEYLGFSNGVLNKVTCEFTEIPSGDLIVSKYFDMEFTSSMNTPLMDSVLQYQFEQPVVDFIYACLGRMFGIRDNLGFMLYLLGEAGCGKSLVIEIISECFNNVGAIGTSFEEKFGLSFLYSKDIVVCDDLPKNISKIFPQQTFQTCITGGKVPIAVKGGEGFTVDWKVPMLFASNYQIDYTDKGQVSRRMLIANFEKIVDKPDVSLKERIIQRELPSIIYKCLTSYKKLLDNNHGKDIWSLCPDYFLEQKTELKMDRNPLFKFLTENSVYKDGNMVALEIVRRRFASWLGTSVKSLDNGTFYQVNKSYEIVKCMICKHCGKAAEKGCCVLYKNSDRTCKKVAKNFCLIEC